MIRVNKKVIVGVITGILVTAALIVAVRRPWSRPSGAGAAVEHREGGEEHEKTEGGDRKVTLSAEALSAARIQVAKAERRRFVREFAFTGEVAFHPDRVAIVGAKMNARILQVSAGVGDRVPSGQVLATLDSADYARARGEYLSAAAHRESAQSAFDRAEQLRTEGINSIRDVEEARAALRTARAEVEAARGSLLALGLAPPSGDADRATRVSSVIQLRSPIAGTVVLRDAIVGQSVEPSTSLFTIADLSEVWVLLDIYERDLGHVAVGAEVSVTTAAFPRRSFEGRVVHISEVLDERTRTAKVRIVIPNRDGALRPGMFCRATLRAGSEAPHQEGGKATGSETAEAQPGEEAEAASGGEAREALVVPVGALQRIGDADVVFVRVEERKFEARTVRVGERGGTSVEILGGLRQGEEVVTEGSLTLKAELARASLGEGDED